MKNLTILSFIFCLTSAPLVAQVQLGAKLGANISKFGGDNSEFEKAKIGGHLGVWASFLVRDKIGLQPELLFSLQGSKTDFSNSNYIYIALPLLVKYLINENLTVLLGPQFGLLASAKQKIDGSGTFDEKEFLTTGDLGAVIGLMYTINIVAHIYVRYVLGLTNINSVSFSGSSFSVTNQLFQLGFAYTLVGN